jgi:hypothetical protein
MLHAKTSNTVGKNTAGSLEDQTPHARTEREKQDLLYTILYFLYKLVHLKTMDFV